MPSITLPAPVIEELRARQALGLDNGLAIETLFALPTARDRRLFKAFLREAPAFAESMTIDKYQSNRIDAQIVNEVRGFLNGSRMLISNLGAETLRNAYAEELRATPSVFLLQMLDSTNAQELADRLIKKLKWYGAKPGEQMPASVRYQLLIYAIRRYLHAPSAEEPYELAGFRWQDPANWGKSYESLHNDFEQHLLNTRRVANSKEAIMLAHVFKTRLSKDFSVRDVPPELGYKSSIVWVNFMHGVLLADEFDLNRSQPLSFQQLVNLPLESSADASAELLEKIVSLRVIPALEWAVCSGEIQYRTDAGYDEEDVQRAMEALEQQSGRLTKAVMDLALTPPQRLKMAKQIKDGLFGEAGFESDGRKLLGLVQLAHGFLDLYADGQLDGGERWFVTEPDGKTRTPETFRIDNKRIIFFERKDHYGDYRKFFIGGSYPKLSGKTLPDINAKFETDFKKHLATSRAAYKTLINSLLTSLPLSDRRALARGNVEVLGLRQIARQDGQSYDVRARKGFILKVNYETDIFYFELIPSAGFIRRRPHLRFSTIDGVRTEFPLHASIPGTTYSPENNLDTTLLIDWSAHVYGKTPNKTGAYFIGMLDKVGRVSPPAPTDTIDTTKIAGLKSRLDTVAHTIASSFLYVDEQELHTQARGMTTYDTIRAMNTQQWEKRLAIAKVFVPFWSSIENLMSDDIQTKLNGLAGVLLDLTSFLWPIGKFISGSIRLIQVGAQVSRMAVKASLPSFSMLTRKLLTSSLRNFNPLDGIPTLIKTLVVSSAKGWLIASRLTVTGVKILAGQTSNYRLLKNLAQAINPETWKPSRSNDDLATVNGVNDVLVRKTGPADSNRFHLVDPVTSLPYGPRLPLRNDQLSLGRSAYRPVAKTDYHTTVELAEKTSVRTVLEVDGRTTAFLDNVPYRLDGDMLRRVDTLDTGTKLKSVPCRNRRAPDGLCKTKYVLDDEPAERPVPGQIIEQKRWAPWFGDGAFYPSTPKSSDDPQLLSWEGKIYQSLDGKLNTYKGMLKKIGLESRTPVANDTIRAQLESQTGIYGSIIMNGTAKGINDIHIVGAIVVPSLNESTRHVFTKLNANDYYLGTLKAGDKTLDPLTMKRLNASELLSGTLGEELLRVYSGSLNANNTARIYGVDALESALKKLNDIAIPIGAPGNPPANMKWLKVDTLPSEAVLFDKKTRLIVAEISDGANL